MVRMSASPLIHFPHLRSNTCMPLRNTQGIRFPSQPSATPRHGTRLSRGRLLWSSDPRPSQIVVRSPCRTTRPPGLNVGGRSPPRALPDCTKQREESPSGRREHIVESEATVHERIAEVRGMLERMGEGDISVSPYDTAWVALARNADGGDGSRFPCTLQWIAEHQLPDGSWGDGAIFEPHDRVLNTLACVIALASYGVCPRYCHRGMVFLRDNLHRIGGANEEHMPIGFELAFPSLLDVARGLGLDLPFDAPCLQRIYRMRSLKMERIPVALMHEVPTTLLHSLEGMASGHGGDLDWRRLLRLQCRDGSFLFSPSSTAVAMLHTGDAKSLGYLEKVTMRFGGGVPNVYPVDLFEHLWVVDRLERLGIARHFKPEIRQCLDYVYKHWTENGIGWASGSNVFDIDDTAMGFRLLRLHGYHVSPDVFCNFHSGGKFFSLAGQSSQAVTGMFNLNRAAHVAFVGEEILDQARRFSSTFLWEKLSTNQVADKWIITKDLKGEVEYALEFPFQASLPRVEARMFLQQYGGEDDAWIGKTLYRMPLVNNNAYLELAKADFNTCQGVHQQEWLGFRRWFGECGLAAHGVSRRRLLEAYFLAACSVFERERPAERVGWARTAVLADAVRNYLSSDTCTDEMKRNFLQGLRGRVNTTNSCGWNEMGRSLVRTLRSTIRRISLDAAAAVSKRRQTAIAVHQDRIRKCLEHVWEGWIETMGEHGDDEALLLCRTLELCAGRYDLEEVMPFSSVSRDESSANTGDATGSWKARLGEAAALTSTMGRCLRRHLNDKDEVVKCKLDMSVPTKLRGEEIDDSLEEGMKELLKCVLENSTGDGRETMQTFLMVAKTFFYVYHCRVETMETHIDMVLFEKVA